MHARSTGRGRGVRLAAAGLVAFSLVAAACGDKKDDDAVEGGDTTEAPAATEAPDSGGTEAPETEGTEPPAPVVTEPPAAEFDPVVGGRLVVAGEAEVANPWTPANMQCDSFCQMRARTFYDPLVVTNSDLEAVGFLAESVTPNEDNTVFTIKLREGISFHDGEPFNADAAMANINRSFNSLLLGAALKDVARNADGTIVMEKLDDFTFTIATGLNGDPAQPLPWPLFPYYLGGQAGLMASPAWLDAVDAGSADPSQPVGTGPFVFDSYAPGDKLVVKKNPNYWVIDENGTQLPYLDEIEFRVIPDSQVRGQALQSGDVDLISTSDSAVIADFEGDDSFNLVRQDQFSETNYILFNLTKPYLADKRVRCGLLQAVDKEDLIAVVAQGNGVPANGPFTNGQEGFLTDNGSLPFDTEAAAAQIAEYEAENGELTINYSTTPTATSLTTAQYLQGVWGEIGVDVTIDQIEQSKLINNALFGDPAFDAFGWRNHAGIFVDQQYFWWHSSAAADPGSLALNFGRLRDPEIDAALEASRSEADPEVRRGLAEDINRRFASECWIIPTSFTQWGVIHDPAVQNIGRSPLPEGAGFMRDGAGFPGQVWLTAVFLAQ
ncbi:MAG: ABC transporter substrate-binding protein [Ilumatobacteraceae bacterium]|nr:ABC transporter substrate-binding protein [Ilumatobacteraceae bacterium]